MAAPNIVNVTTINGKTKTAALGTTTTTSILANAAGSSKVLRVINIHVTNIDGTNPADVTLSHYDGVSYIPLASLIAVPARGALSLIDKPLYLEEGHSIAGGASASGDLVVVISYEEIS